MLYIRHVYTTVCNRSALILGSTWPSKSSIRTNTDSLTPLKKEVLEPKSVLGLISSPHSTLNLTWADDVLTLLPWLQLVWGDCKVCKDKLFYTEDENVLLSCLFPAHFYVSHFLKSLE